MRLRLDDLRSPHWTWTGRRWVSQDSWIRPFQNPAVISQLVLDPAGQVGVVIQEGTDQPVGEPHDRRPRRVADVDTLLAAVPDPSRDYLTIRLTPERVTVSAGPLGTAPIYLTSLDDLLLASWNLRDLAPYVHPDRVLSRAITRRLTRQARYTNDTVLADVHRMTERSTATFTRTGLTLTYPAPAEHVIRPRQVRPGTDVVAVFDELLREITPRLESVGVELSGGADSANVALALATLRSTPVSSYGLILDGQVGAQQRHRRAAMVHQFGLRDVTVHAFDHPPFAPTGVRGLAQPHDPTSAYYREAFDALRDAVATNSTKIICTGLGGDELVTRHPHERIAPPPPPEAVPWLGPVARRALEEVDDNLAPVAPVPITALMAKATHNPAYLTAGIWPVAPLAHPGLVRFAKQLPLDWRAGKRLLRERLRRTRLVADVVNPPQPETFSDLMQTGLRRHGLPLLKAMLTESRLVDLGYLDHAALIHAYDTALTAARVPSTLCDAISLEVGLRSLDRAGCRT